MCFATVGVIDPVTSALHIIIGEERLLLFQSLVHSFFFFFKSAISNSFDNSERCSLAYVALLISQTTLQETLSLWMCVQSIKPLPWCATQCLCWAMASMETYWLRAKNTAGWDLYDMTIQACTDGSFIEQK